MAKLALTRNFMVFFVLVVILRECALRKNFVVKALVGLFAKISNAVEDRKVHVAPRRKRHIASSAGTILDATRQGGVLYELHQAWSKRRRIVTERQCKTRVASGVNIDKVYLWHERNMRMDDCHRAHRNSGDQCVYRSMAIDAEQENHYTTGT